MGNALPEEGPASPSSASSALEEYQVVSARLPSASGGKQSCELCFTLS